MEDDEKPLMGLRPPGLTVVWRILLGGRELSSGGGSVWGEGMFLLCLA